MKTSSFVTSTAWLLSVAQAQQFVQYTPGGDDTSVQRADPILAPGSISQHVHQIFGSNGFAPDSTYEELQKSGCTTVGDASGNGNAQDKSIYWHPALYMEAADGSGYIKVPTNGHKLYYKNAGTGTPRSPFEFPHGFRMLAGNPFMRAPATNVQQQNITQWICHANAVSYNRVSSFYALSINGTTGLEPGHRWRLSQRRDHMRRISRIQRCHPLPTLLEWKELRSHQPNGTCRLSNRRHRGGYLPTFPSNAPTTHLYRESVQHRRPRQYCQARLFRPCHG